MSYKIPALIIARGIQALPECLEMAEKHNVTVLSCKDTTSYIVSSLITYLKRNLAPRVTRHGVLVEIYGEGILLSLIHISEPTRRVVISYAVFCLKKFF